MKPLLLKIWRHLIPEPLRHFIIRTITHKFNVGLAGVFFDADGRVLLFFHTYRPRPWGVPTGWLEQGEQPHAGLLREVEEESMLKVDILGTHQVQADRSRLEIVMVGRFLGGDFRPSAEISKYDLFHIDSLPEGLHPPQRGLIKEVWEAWQGRL